MRYELKRLDPESYENIDIANPQRVVRALEVTLQTGRKFSDWKTGGASATGRAFAMPQKNRPFKIEKIGITRNRTELYERINARVDGMMHAGLLDEVRNLRHFSPEYPSLRTVGYRELFDYLDGKTDLVTATDLIKRNTRHYAKRQLTWWARDKNIRWINLSGTKN